MGWDAIGKALSGALGGTLGNFIGGALSNSRQAESANQAAAAQQASIASQLATLRGMYDQSMGLQQDQFNRNLGLQQGQFNQGLGLQRGFLDEALGRLDAQSGGQLATLQGLFSPYTQAGANALGGMNQYAQGGLQAFGQQLGLSGALGADAQQQAISGLSSSPLFQALAKQGEDAILANASATGGLRGGNTQAALAQFRPGLLNQFMQQQFGNLGSLSSLGASNLGSLASLGQGSAGQQGQLGQSGYGQNLGLLGQLYGSAAGNVASAGNQLMGGIGSASNAYAGNVADIIDKFAGTLATLQGRQGDVTARNALAQGAFRGNINEGFGGLLGNAIQAIFKK